MKVLCIEKTDKSNKIKKMLNTVTYHENKIVVYSDLEKVTLKNKIKIVKKIKRIITKENVNIIIPSIEIKKNNEFVNLLYSNNINITNERWLFKMLTYDVINKLISENKKPQSEISITVNDIDNITNNIIYKFAKEFKRVNIITNHIRKFKKIEERLFEEGIIITITNNKRKSLLKSELILNIDFPKEILNQFEIFDEATIINLEGNMAIKKKRFCGKVINNIEIKSYENIEIQEFIEKNNLENYDIKDICNVLNIVPKCDIILV